MGLKGTIRPDHINKNKYKLIIPGLPNIVFTTTDSIEEALDVVDLPDRTKASGGNTQPVEFTAKVPLHHDDEQRALEAWFLMCQDPVLPSYKRNAILIYISNSSLFLKSYTLKGLFITGRTLPDNAMDDEGAMQETEWKFSADQIIPN